jgi:2,3-bisphosphoglycerate-independent phosphoglycerate mutase
VPFAIWYPGIEADEVQTFDEDAAKAGAYGLLEGDHFIKVFMNKSVSD